MSAPHPIPPAAPDLSDALASLDELPSELGSAEIVERRVQDLDASGRRAADLRLLDSRLERVDLSGSVMPRSSITDVVVEGGSWANAELADSTLRGWSSATSV